MPDYDFTGLESLLAEARKYAIPPKETTLFAVGGRGYYENPASDLLAFFLQPDAEHGLGNLFLSTFLELIVVEHRQLNMKSCVSVLREAQTEDLSRIDLRIIGPDWCLLIENKIRHGQSNPFTSYEAHAKGLRKKEKTFLAILSPDGHSEADGWIGVSYEKYCLALRAKLAAMFFESPLSKWHVFAREFILHMENELYNPPMTNDQVAFVEKHADQIDQLQELAQQYRQFVCQELKVRLDKSVNRNTFNSWLDSWNGHSLVIRCKSQAWGDSDMVLFKLEGTGQKFFIRAYLEDGSEPRLSNAKLALNDMQYESGRYPYWTSPAGYDSRDEAIDELCKLAQIVSDLLRT
jgi:hypothetical protein